MINGGLMGKGLALLILIVAANNVQAAQGSVSHRVGIRIEPMIIIYVDTDGILSGLFHIRGSRDVINSHQIRVYKNGVRLGPDSQILMRFSALKTSGEVDWNRTGYYPLSKTDSIDISGNIGVPGQRIVTVMDGEAGIEFH